MFRILPSVSKMVVQLLQQERNQCSSCGSASLLSFLLNNLRIKNLLYIEHQVELPVLHSNFPLAIYFTYGNISVSMLLFQSITPSNSPTVSKVCSLCLHLYSCPADWLINTVFIDPIYMHWFLKGWNRVGSWGRGSKGSRHTYAYGWFTLLYGRSQQNSIGQLSSN